MAAANIVLPSRPSSATVTDTFTRRQNSPQIQSPEETLSDVGIVLPSLHLGSFSKMYVEEGQVSHSVPQRPRARQHSASSTRNTLASYPTPTSPAPLMEEPQSESDEGSPQSGTRAQTAASSVSYPSRTRSPRPQSSFLRTPEQHDDMSNYFPSDSQNVPSGDTNVVADKRVSRRRESRPTSTGRSPSRSVVVEPQLKMINGPWRADSHQSQQRNDQPPIDDRDSRPSTSQRIITTGSPAVGANATISSFPSPATLVSSPATIPSSPFVARNSFSQTGNGPSPMMAAPSPPPPRPSPTTPARPQFAQRVQQPQEEVCIECMMRDKDLEDVDVTGEGVWERASDVWYSELVRKEEDDQRAGIPPAEGKPRARGGLLTEANIALWLAMNPKEPASRWNTLEKYIKSQAALLAEESNARDRSIRDARARDRQMRDTYLELRRSTNDITRVDLPGGEGPIDGVRLNSSAGYSSDGREITLLETGMILEHVDLRRQEKEERDRRLKEEKQARKNGRKSASGGSASISSATSPWASLGFSKSQVSLANSAAYSNRRMSSPMALSPSVGLPERPPMVRGSSQISTESRGTPRFLGFRHWKGAYGSEASLHHNSGSMLDMHLGLEQDHDRFAPSFDAETLSPEIELETQLDSKQKKKKGLGRLWKKMTGKESEKENANTSSRNITQEDLNVPLAPPPSLSYLVSRSSGSERSPRSPVLHSPSASNSSTYPSGRPPSIPSGLAVFPKSGSASITSSVPSPTSTNYNRYSRRDSTLADPSFVDSVEIATDDESFERRGRRGVHLSTPSISRNQTFSHQSKKSQTVPLSQIPSLPQGTRRTSAPTERTIGRPSSVASVYKDLPPLPNEPPDNSLAVPRNRSVSQYHPQPLQSPRFSVRPVTSYDPLEAPPPTRPPLAPFHSEPRRQSFSGRMSASLNSVFSRTRKSSDLNRGLFDDSMSGAPGSMDVYPNGGGYIDEFGSTLSFNSPPSPRSPTPLLHEKPRPRVSSTLGRESMTLAAPLFDSNNARSTKSRSSRLGFSSFFSSNSRRSQDREDALRQTALMDGTGVAPADGRIYARNQSPSMRSAGFVNANSRERASSPWNGGFRASRSEVALRDSASASAGFVNVSRPMTTVASLSRNGVGMAEMGIRQEDHFLAYRYPSEADTTTLLRRSR